MRAVEIIGTQDCHDMQYMFFTFFIKPLTSTVSVIVMAPYHFDTVPLKSLESSATKVQFNTADI